MKILAFGTYPTRIPVHGGQRRSSQIGAYYTANGAEYAYASVYQPRAYSADAVGPYDYPFGAMEGLFAKAPFIDDLASGEFAATRAEVYNNFVKLVDTYQPDVVQLEQPFLWPLIKRLIKERKLDGVKIVYSSHNLEAPLKFDLLESAGVSREINVQVERRISDLENELADRADLIISVSKSEADTYREMNGLQRPIVIRNGADRLGHISKPVHGEELLPEEYMVFVGSAYPPNIDGFCKYVLKFGLYGFPPEKRFAICGGVSEGIYQSGLYAPHQGSYQDRVQFFSCPSDSELSWIRSHAKGFLLPIESGGGSNLKTAEALSSGKWVVTTQKALRSFEDFSGQAGVIVADTPRLFREAMLEVTYGAPLALNHRQVAMREGLYWDRLMSESGLMERLSSVVETETTAR